MRKMRGEGGGVWDFRQSKEKETKGGARSHVQAA